MGDKPSPNCPTGFSEPRSGKFVEGMHRGFSRVDGKASELDLNGNFDEAGKKDEPEADKSNLCAKDGSCDQLSGSNDGSRKDKAGAKPFRGV